MNNSPCHPLATALDAQLVGIPDFQQAFMVNSIRGIRPWVVRLEQAMNRALFSDKEKGVYYVRFNMDGLMRGDYKSRMEGYAIGRQNGWMSANDIRELENMNPIPDADGGNEYLVNGNMVRIAQAAQNGGEQSGA